MQLLVLQISYRVLPWLLLCHQRRLFPLSADPEAVSLYRATTFRYSEGDYRAYAIAERNRQRLRMAGLSVSIAEA